MDALHIYGPKPPHLSTKVLGVHAIELLIILVCNQNLNKCVKCISLFCLNYLKCCIRYNDVFKR